MEWLDVHVHDKRNEAGTECGRVWEKSVVGSAKGNPTTAENRAEEAHECKQPEKPCFRPDEQEFVVWNICPLRRRRIPRKEHRIVIHADARQGVVANYVHGDLAD